VFAGLPRRGKYEEGIARLRGGAERTVPGYGRQDPSRVTQQQLQYHPGMDFDRNGSKSLVSNNIQEEFKFSQSNTYSSSSVEQQFHHTQLQSQDFESSSAPNVTSSCTEESRRYYLSHRRDSMITDDQYDSVNEPLPVPRDPESHGMYRQERNESASQMIPSISSFSKRNPPPRAQFVSPVIREEPQEFMLNEVGENNSRRFSEGHNYSPDAVASQDVAEKFASEAFRGRCKTDGATDVQSRSTRKPDLIQIPLDLSAKTKYDEFLRAYYSGKDIEPFLKLMQSRVDGPKRSHPSEWDKYEMVRQRARTADWPASGQTYWQRGDGHLKKDLEETFHGGRDGLEARQRAGSFPSSEARFAWRVAQEREIRRMQQFQAHSNFPYHGNVQKQTTDARSDRGSDSVNMWQSDEQQCNDLPQLESIASLRCSDENPKQTSFNANHNYDEPILTSSSRAPNSSSPDRTSEKSHEPDADDLDIVDSREKLRMLSEVAGKEEDSGKERSVECPHCRIIFPDYVLYTLHMGYHSHSDPFLCNKCGHQTTNHREFFLHIARVAHE